MTGKGANGLPAAGEPVPDEAAAGVILRRSRSRSRAA
jgi:hypothetical protein